MTVTPVTVTGGITYPPTVTLRSVTVLRNKCYACYGPSYSRNEAPVTEVSDFRATLRRKERNSVTGVEMDTKICRQCHRELPLTDFEKTRDWYRGSCIECRTSRRREYERQRAEGKRAKPALPKPTLVDEQEAYEAVLWSVVGQAASDATTDKPYSGEAMSFLERMFGSEHRITRGVQTARQEGKHLVVNLHVQDSVKGAR